MSKSEPAEKDMLMRYLSILKNEQELKVWHLAILTAILYLGQKQGRNKKIRVSRRKIMELSHINTLPTYHKYFNELQKFGYIIYTPSYHPEAKSEVVLIKKRLSQI
jgi:hypothetical protein